MEVIGSSPVSPTNLQYRCRVSRLCERPGCSAVASVAYGFDTKALVVWIGALASDDTEFGVGVLCRRHADALVVPKDWRVDDRREAVPRLFAVKSAPEAPVEPAKKPAMKRMAETPESGEPGPGLFDDVASADNQPSGSQPSGNEAAATLDETRAIPWMPTFGDDDIDEPSQSESPPTSGLLGRAFGSKDRRERR